MCEFPIQRHVQLQHMIYCVTGILTQYYHAGAGSRYFVCKYLHC